MRQREAHGHRNHECVVKKSLMYNSKIYTFSTLLIMLLRSYMHD